MTKLNKNNLSVKLEELRESLQSSTITKSQVWLNKEAGSWDILWSAFDNIQDSQKAIDQFPALNAEYLGVYGLLQAMVVQQDSIQHLANVLGLPQLKWSNYPELQKIRDVRVATIGHPTDINKIKKHGARYEDGDISHSSMAIGVMHSEILEYIEWSKAGAEPNKIDLRYAINRQKELLTSLVKTILDDIEEKEKKHIKKFSDNKLENNLSSCGYFISKLWPFERDRMYSESCFRMLSKAYSSFKDQIKQRYGYDSLEFQPGLKMEIEKVDKLLPRIEKMIPMGQNVDEFNLEVYVESLQNSFDVLKKMAKEIDEKFSLQENELETK